MATSRTPAVPDPLYRSLVWLALHAALLLSVGVPLVLLVWASVKREQSLLRLLAIYWKVASLLLIADLLLSDRRPIGFVVLVLAPLLVAVSLWFWVDLNEEITDLPPWRPLPLSVRIWRWGVTFWAGISAALSAMALGCIDPSRMDAPRCAVWLLPPSQLHQHLETVFGFVFGGQWTPAVAAFVGYVGLLAYVVGLLQWLLVRLPKLGRVAGEF